MKFTRNYVESMIADNNYEETVFITEKGHKVTVSPCYFDFTKDPDSPDEVEYWIIETSFPISGEEEFDKLVDKLNNIDKMYEDIMSERAKCYLFFDEHQRDGWTQDDWDWYSDWHKDLFGYRPHGEVFGVYINPHATGVY